MPLYLNRKRIAPTKLVYSGGYETYTGNYTINPASTNIVLSTTNKLLTQNITVNAMPSLTLPQTAANSATSGYTSITTIDPSTADRYINIGTGYNNNASYYKISKMPSGTAGTPVATKGSVSNNSISITPSVTNITGYITGSTKTGTAVSVTASELVSGTLSITSNGTKDVTNYKNVNVQIGSDVNNQDKTISPTTSEQIVTADSGYSGLGTVTINAMPSGTVTAPASISGSSATVSNGTNTITLTKTISVTPNVTTAGYVSSGTAGNASVSLTANVTTKGATSYTPTTTSQIIASGIYLTGNQTILGDSNLVAGNIKKNISIFGVTGTYEPPAGDTINNQDKTVTPTESEQFISADSGYTGLGVVTVEGISSTYVGSDIARRSSSNLTASGATVTVPAGYYASNGSKSVATTTHPDPTVSINSSTGLVTASHIQGTGYVTGSTTTDTLQLSTQAATTITPTKSSQTAVEAGKYTTGAVTVGAYTPSLQEKTVTPIKSTQIVEVDGPENLVVSSYISRDSYGYRGAINADFSSFQVGDKCHIVGYVMMDDSNDYPVSGSAADIEHTFEWTGNGYTYYVNWLSPSNYRYKIDISSTKFVIRPVDESGYVPNGVTNFDGYRHGPTAADDENYRIKFYRFVSTYDGLSKVTVNPIPSEYIIPTGTKMITENGTNIDVAQYESVDVNVSGGGSEPVLQAKTNITPTESSQTITADSGYDGLSSVQINAISSTYVGTGITRRASSDLTASSNVITAPAGYYSTAATYTMARRDLLSPTMTIDTTQGIVTGTSTIAADKGGWYAGAQTASKTLQLTTQEGATITPTESEQTAVAANVYTLGAIKIGAISSSYIGSAITRRSSSDLTASGAVVTVPAGYYASQATKSVTTMTLPTSAASSATSGYTSKATIGRSTSNQYINIPPGYNSAGGYYTISATPNGSVTAPSTISGTTASISTGTNTLTLTKTISVTPNVTTAGYISAGTAGNSSVSLTATVATQGARIISPSTTDEIITSGTYLTGNTTVKAVQISGLTAANIKSGVTIKIGDELDDDCVAGITGTFSSDATATASSIVSGDTAYVDGRLITGELVINNYYTGSSAPSSSLGSNGDIYIQQ